MSNTHRRAIGYYNDSDPRYRRATMVDEPAFSMIKAARRRRIPPTAIVALFFAAVFSTWATLLFARGRSDSPAVLPTPKDVVVQKFAPPELGEALVPLSPIPAGKLLRQDMFVKVKRERNSLPDQAIRDFEEIEGTYSRYTMQPERLIYRESVTTEKPVNAVIANIPAGYRAVTISVNATSAVEGWASASANVDVHLIANLSGQPTASLLVENAKVLSAERQADPDVKSGTTTIPTTVTLLASEKDAQKISLGGTLGSLVLHLRGASDPAKATSTRGTLTPRDLLGKPLKEQEETDIEGFVRMRQSDGSYKELAVKRGQLVKRQSD